MEKEDEQEWPFYRERTDLPAPEEHHSLNGLPSAKGKPNQVILTEETSKQSHKRLNQYYKSWY